MIYVQYVLFEMITEHFGLPPSFLFLIIKTK